MQACVPRSPCERSLLMCEAAATGVARAAQGAGAWRRTSTGATPPARLLAKPPRWPLPRGRVNMESVISLQRISHCLQGVAVLLAVLQPNNSRYVAAMEGTFDWYLPGPGRTVAHTTGGLAYPCQVHHAPRVPFVWSCMQAAGSHPDRVLTESCAARAGAHAAMLRTRACLRWLTRRACKYRT